MASGIRAFKPPLLKTYRKYIQDEKKREELHRILEVLVKKGYNLPDPKYKRTPANFDKDDENIYLALYGSVFVYKTYKIDDVFYTLELIDKVFADYSDMKDLQQWVYEMESYGKVNKEI